MRVLLADDALFVRKTLAEMLTRLGHTVVGEAATGAEAAALARETGPEVVLLDVAMPDGDGIDALTQIRRLAPTLPAVVCSLLRSPERDRRIQAAGGAVWLEKPFDSDGLEAALREAVASRSERAA
jgi:two-component system chemotaxis response regulator CheY